MEKVFVDISRNSRLILIFAGWGMDSAPFRTLAKPGYDILVVSDYTGFDPVSDIPELARKCAGYDEIVVLAWSFGVRIAQEFLSAAKGKLPVTGAIAVNGTTTHVDDLRGISQSVFSGTLANLSPATVRKFRRRMFSSASGFEAFQNVAPSRGFESLRDELETFASLEPVAPDSALWDLAVGGTCDAIFPIAAQRCGWQGVSFREEPDMPHFPDFQKIIDCDIVDKQLVASRFAAAATTYTDNASVQTGVAMHLWNAARTHVDTCLKSISPRKADIVEVGAGTGTLTRLYAASLSDHDVELWDIAPAAPQSIPEGFEFRCCDAETAIRGCADSSADIILSASALQWFNSPVSFVRESLRVLRPGGLLALSVFGPQTYQEISSVTGVSLNYPSLDALLGAVAAEEVILAEESFLTGMFDSAREVLRHMKLTGVNALPPRGSGETLRLVRNYPLTAGGKAPLTYNPVYIIVKKRQNG